MALGGGVWVTQNKILPGSYINVISAASTSAKLGERGIAAIALPLGTTSSETAGTIVRLTFRQFVNDSKELLPNAPESTMIALRELFCNATEVLVYDSYNGTQAATNAVVTIALNGTGTTTGVEITGGTTTVGTLGAETVNSAALSAGYTLQVNGESKDWTDDSSEVIPTSAVIVLTSNSTGPLAGTAKSDFEAITGAISVQVVDGKQQSQVNKPTPADICKALEPYYFNTLACYTDDQTEKADYINLVKSWREDVGKKVQAVVHDAEVAPDYEGIINVVSTVSDEGAPEHALVAWVTGAEAGCAVNASVTNKIYDGEYHIVCDHTQIELEDIILAGQFAFHLVYDDIRVLTDINSLTTVTETKGEDFKSNQTMRVIDQIANDIAYMFNTKYIGVIPNDQSGRTSLWADIVKHHQELETMRAIENFDSSQVVVERGNTKKSVVVTDAVIPVNAMEQLYMTLVIY